MAARSYKLGIELWPQNVTWPEMEQAVRTADASGLDSLWTWDHLYAVVGEASQPIFEGWTTISAWAAITTSATIGLLVGANTFRNPGVVAKAAVTLDHISRGRCVLGLGAAWFRPEHHAFGLEFGASVGQRLDWLEEAAAAIRSLLLGDVVDSPPGGRYAFRELTLRPLPVRGPGSLPLLIAGSGERKTLRIVARYADLWCPNGSSPEELERKVDVLDQHCLASGRDRSDIEFLLARRVIIRDSIDAARVEFERCLRLNGATASSEDWLGPPDLIASRWAPYAAIGFRHLVGILATPFDTETIERLSEVKALVA